MTAMEVTDTQKVDQGVSAAPDVLAQALGIATQPAQVQEVVATTVAAAPEPVATTPVLTPEVVQEVKAETAVIDPFEAIVTGAPVAEAVAFNDDGMKAFEQMFGTKDPAAFKTEVETIRTQAELAKAEMDKWLPLKQKIDGLSPAETKAFQLMLEGKGVEAQDYIKSLPDVVFQNKEAKVIDTEKLVKTYFPGKVTDEQYAMLKDPEADPELVDALKTRLGILRDAATDMHEAKRQEASTSMQTQQKAQEEAYAKFQKDTAAAIAHVKASPLKGLVDQQLVEEIQTGKYLSKFVQEDGITPTRESAELYLKALHADKLMEAKGRVEYQRGKNDGMLEATSRQPNGARPTRDGGDAPTNGQGPSVKDTILAQVFKN